MPAALWLAAAAAAAAPRTVRVVDGRVDGKYVGTHTTELQANVVDALFPPVSAAAWKDAQIVNATVLRYLDLVGDYLADRPLRLPDLFVLRLSGSLAAAANLSDVAPARSSALVELNGTHYSAVIGGTYNATAAPGYSAVAVEHGTHNAVRGIRAVANATPAAISAINCFSGTEIAFCDVGGDAAAPMEGRCIWTLASSHAMVHDNHVHHCSTHALDFDAYTSDSACYNNLCEDNRQEGIFVEESASGNVVFNNTCRRNGNGIGVYANAVGPVQKNFFLANTVTDNTGNGITAGGYGHGNNKYSEGNVFISNAASGNGFAWNPMHGGNIGDFWTSNTHSGGGPEWSRLPSATANVSIFEP